MTCLDNIYPESTCNQLQLNFEDFQFDLENALTISQLIGKSTEEGHAATLIIEILKSTEGKTATEVSVMTVTDQARSSGLEVSQCCKQTQLEVQQELCETTLARDMVHGL